MNFKCATLYPSSLEQNKLSRLQMSIRLILICCLRIKHDLAFTRGETYILMHKLILLWHSI